MKFHLLFKKLFLMYDNSYKMFHVLALIAIAIISFLFCKLDVTLDESKTGTLVTTLGILTTFFLIATEKVDTYSINRIFTYPKTIRSIIFFKKKSFTDGKLHKNTIFSVVFTNVVLVFFLFVFYLLNLDLRYILISSTVYLFFGFTYMVLIWNLGINESNINK